MHDYCEPCGVEIPARQSTIVRWRPGKVGQWPKMTVCRACHLRLNVGGGQ